ncbi:MAG: OmpA family protein [Bacteroidota bacterium]
MRYSFVLFLFFTQYLTAQVPPVFDSLQAYYSTTLYFDSGSAELDSTALKTLAECPSPSAATDRLYLTGHTDAIGSIAYNEDLAIRRATSAKGVLENQDWSDGSMVIQTFGERTPVANNEREEGRRRNRRVTLDFYRAVPYRAFSGKVINPETNQPVPNALVNIHGRSFSDTLTVDSSGRFSTALPIDTVVGIEVYAKGFFLTNQMLKMRPGTAPEIPLKLPEAKEGAVADIEDLFFVGNEAILLPRSKEIPAKILRFMQINTHLRVEIAGHVNFPNRPPVTEDTFEWDLSWRRAKLIYDYLIDNDIPAENLTYQGYGNHEMRYPKAVTPADQEANRRVEIRVLEVLK